MSAETFLVDTPALQVGDVVKASTYMWMSQDALEEKNVQLGIPGTIVEITEVGRCKVEVLKRFIKSWVLRQGLEFKWFTETPDKKSVTFNHMFLTDFVKSAASIPEATIHDLVKEAFPSPHLAVWTIYHTPEINTKKLCMVIGCDEKRLKVTWHNCHGAVQGFHTCGSHHQELNGRLSDGFPCKDLDEEDKGSWVMLEGKSMNELRVRF